MSREENKRRWAKNKSEYRKLSTEDLEYKKTRSSPPDREMIQEILDEREKEKDEQIEASRFRINIWVVIIVALVFFILGRLSC